jgi:predicted phage-related endonuclease
VNVEPIKGIGGTLVGAILGVNPWKSPLQAYNEIFGLEDMEEREAMRWGQKLEPLLAREYQERTGLMLWPNIEMGLDYRKPLRNAWEEWWTGTPDRLVIQDGAWLVNPKDPKAVEAIEEILADPLFWKNVIKGWEGKTAGYRQMPLWGECGTDEVPEIYLVQSHWYLDLVRSYNPDIEEWDLSVLLGGQEFRSYTIKHNPKLGQVIYRTAKKFWEEHVLRRTPPAPSADPAWKEFFRHFYPEATRPLEEATPGETRLFLDLWVAHRRLKKAEEDYESIVNALKLQIGEREGIQGVLTDMIDTEGRVADLAWKVTWKATKPIQKTDWKGVIQTLQDRLPDLVLTIEEVVAEHTETVPGTRRFVPSWPKVITTKKKEKSV